MPVYEYLCPTCQDRFELLRPMSQAAEDASCPSGHPGAKRLISRFAVLSTGGDGLPGSQSGTASCASCSASSCDSCRI